MADDALEDYRTLGRKLASVIELMGDPEAHVSGSDAASLVRTRRALGAGLDTDLVADLRADYDLLEDALHMSRGSAAAAVAQERRMVRRLLAALAAPEGVSKVESLDSWRASRTAASGIARGRRQSGRSARGH